MRKRKLLFLGVAALCAWGLFAAPVRGETFIVKDGQPRAGIVISEKPARMVKLAAEELQAYIEKISGAKLPIATETSNAMPVNIYVGQSKYTDALKLGDEGLKYGAFKMVAGKDYLVLLGHDSDFTPPKPYSSGPGDWQRMLKEWDALTGEKWGNPRYHLFKQYSKAMGLWEQDERGSLNAVYEFLRMQGVRWYLPDSLGEIVPKKPSIELPTVDKTVRPDFAIRFPYQYSREFCNTNREEILWQLRLGFNVAPDLLGVGSPYHGISFVLGRDRDDIKKAHPEYFALYGGKRDIEKKSGICAACLSSPGLFESNVKYVRAIFDIYNAPAVSVMLPDGFGTMCQCDLCKGKDTPERGYSGQFSDYVWDYVNRVAKEAYKTHPDRKIMCEAYGNYSLPPLKIKEFSPNVVVGITNGRMSYYDPEARRKLADLCQEWLAKMPEGNRKFHYIGDYYLYASPGCATEFMPVFFPHAIAEDIHSMKDITMGECSEVYREPGEGLGKSIGVTHLNLYVTSRFWWDADQDVDKLLDEYYTLFYGPAAGEMKTFIEFSEKNWMNLKTSVTNIDKTFEFLAAARKAAGDTVYGKRVDLVADYITPLKERLAKNAETRKNVPQAQALERRGVDLKIDGKLDEDFWKGVPVYDLKELKTGNPPGSKTTFQVVWADRTLCIGIRCEEADMKNPTIATTNNEDLSICDGDDVEVFLETPIHAYYQIVVNPVGAVADLDWKKGMENRWSSCAEIAVHRGADFWSVEMRIPTSDAVEGGVDPLKCVEGRKPTTADPWYFNVCRQRIRGKDVEASGFSPTGKSAFHVPLKFGKLIVE